jgi:hypothetical protein
MLTEFEVRHSVLDIVMSPAVPTRKVRQLIQLARSLKRESRALLHARALSAQAEDCNTAAHMDRLIRRLLEQYDDVRLVADRIRSDTHIEAGSDLALA